MRMYATKFLIAGVAILSFCRFANAGESNSGAQAIDNMRFRAHVVERLTALEAFQHKDAQTQWKISELERKVEGMQKQITILHAKAKAVSSEDTQIIERLTAACARVESDVKRLKQTSILTNQELNKLRKPKGDIIIYGQGGEGGKGGAGGNAGYLNPLSN